MQATAALGMDLTAGETSQHNPTTSQATNNFANTVDTSKNNQIVNLISLLQENMPSDQSSPLGQQLNNIMSLRMILLRSNRTSEEEQLLETILVLFESYIAAGRTRLDTTLLVTRDYEFHTQYQQRMVMMNQPMGPTEPSPMMMQGSQQQLHPQPMLRNFNQPGPLGGRPQTASATSTGSFLPPPIQPFVSGVGGQLPVLQNVVHPYPPQPQHPTGGGMQMDITLQQAMLIDGYPSEEPTK